MFVTRFSVATLYLRVSITETPTLKKLDIFYTTSVVCRELVCYAKSVT